VLKENQSLSYGGSNAKPGNSRRPAMVPKSAGVSWFGQKISTGTTVSRVESAAAPREVTTMTEALASVLSIVSGGREST
jgi:hypothetical protein